MSIKAVLRLLPPLLAALPILMWGVAGLMPGVLLGVGSFIIARVKLSEHRRTLTWGGWWTSEMAVSESLRYRSGIVIFIEGTLLLVQLVAAHFGFDIAKDRVLEFQARIVVTVILVYCIDFLFVRIMVWAIPHNLFLKISFTLVYAVLLASVFVEASGGFHEHKFLARNLFLASFTIGKILVVLRNHDLFYRFIAAYSTKENNKPTRRIYVTFIACIAIALVLSFAFLKSRDTGQSVCRKTADCSSKTAD